jgi:hypothetical protein
MAKGSADNEMGPMEEMKRAHGTPNKAPLGVESTLPEGMKDPVNEGEHAMGGVHKGMGSGAEQNTHMGNSSMGAAVRQLEYETERNEHAPDVAGVPGTGAAHHGIMKKA